ncbi:hypothetical protein [Moorena sp. SIO4A5]|uniref:hypothetical protein n=1 Tax=Moorena sp. SIO4A5 TaxID=2607838 RepID=UPI0014189B24|nr:hypothetical protein [Moorena sp. SIO4A5]NEO48152.1 hypothetical protein [Moorena sp. SIO4A3]
MQRGLGGFPTRYCIKTRYGRALGERPIAIVQHRYQWLYVYGFVQPKTGKTLWYLIPRVNTEWLNLVYKSFAKDVGISPKKKCC